VASIRIGVRAHDLGKAAPEVMAERVAGRGLSCIQLTLPEAIEGLDGAQGRLNPGISGYIGEAFRARGVQIAVLSCYINLIHPDQQERQKRIRRMLDAIRSNNLQIVFDAVNLLSPDKESFRLFGDCIAVLHAKDFLFEGGRIRSVPLDQGRLNYRLLLGLLKQRKPLLNVIMEDTQPATIDASRDYLKKIYTEL
jgi:sugar phosphate isomerase/epimerase